MRQHDATFEDLVARRYNALLRTGFLITGDQETARDLVQTALTRAYARRSAPRDPHVLEQYVRRTMVNAHISWWRRHRGRETTAASPPEGSYHEGGADERIDLWRALQQLPPRQRVVLVLRYYEDLPTAQVAELMGCSVPTVKTHTARALTRLRAVIEDRCSDVEDGRTQEQLEAS